MASQQLQSQQDFEQIENYFPNRTFISSWAWNEFRNSIGKSHELWFGEIEGEKILIPIENVKAKRGNYLLVREGPHLNWNKKEIVKEVKNFLLEKAKSFGASVVRISPPLVETQENIQLIESYQFKEIKGNATDARRTLLIDLTKDEEQLLAEMRKNTRYRIKQAENKFQIKVENGVEESDFKYFQEIYEDTVKRQGWSAHEADYIKIQYDIFRKYNMARMFTAFYEGRAIASGLFIIYNGQLTSLHSGTLSEFYNIPSNYLLRWEAMKWGKAQGLKYHNVFGIAPKDKPKHPWAGISEYKRGFGGEEVQYINQYDLITSFKGNLMRWFEFLEAKKRGY